MEIKNRLFEQEISEWYKESNGDALVVTGARQVGKTTGVVNWAKSNDIKMLYINLFDQEELVEPLAHASSYDDVLKKISMFLSVDIKDTQVIFLDEVQVDKNILYLARIFKNKKIKLIMSGSLLTTKLSLAVTRTDVGSKRYLRVYPLDFKEFAIWTGNEQLLTLIDESFEKKQQIIPTFHNKLLDLYKQYLIVGGMPEVVSEYLNADKKITKNVYLKKQSIINDYIHDNHDSLVMPDPLNKPTIQTMDIIYNSLEKFIIQPRSKKFIIDSVNKNFRYSNIQIPLNVLKNCNTVIIANNVDAVSFPLTVHIDEPSFKLYYSDVGLLTQKLNMDENSLLQWDSKNKESDVWGGIFENAIATDLQNEQLFYWKKTIGTHSYEIDLLLQWENNDIYPVEIKSKSKGHKRAQLLKKYIEIYNPKKCILIGPNNFHFSDDKIMIPLYAVYKLRTYLK